MKRDQDIFADLPAYALHALDDEEAQIAVENLVENDPEAEKELEELLDTVADMSFRVGTATPPPELRERLMATVSADPDAVKNQAAYSSLVSHLEERIVTDQVETEYHETESLWQRFTSIFTTGRIAVATSAASFAVVAIIAVQLGTDNAELNRKIADMEREVAAAYANTESIYDEVLTTEQLLTQAYDRLSQQDAEIGRMSAVNDALRDSINDQISLTYATLRNEYQSPEWQPDAALSNGGYAYILEHKQHPVGALVIGGVQKAEAGEEYRLYLVGEDGPHFVVSFDMNEAGYSTVLFDLPFPLSNYRGAHITLEQADSQPDPSLASPEKRFEPH